MPSRLIRESARTSVSLAQLTDQAERLFWRLITTADDFGRFEADPDIIRSLCFARPVKQHPTTAAVSRCVQMFADADICQLYESEGKKYGVFRGWLKHQGRSRAQKSKYPEPPLLASANICKQPLSNTLVSESVSVSEDSQKNPSSDADAIRLSGLLFELIQIRQPGFKRPDLHTWAKHVERMFRLDQRAPAAVEAVIRWCQADPFWQGNILSIQKLREKYDQLDAKRRAQAAPGPRPRRFLSIPKEGTA